jgi:NTE family protein
MKTVPQLGRKTYRGIRRGRSDLAPFAGEVRRQTTLPKGEIERRRGMTTQEMAATATTASVDETHRADGVFQGGGVKGLALVGALLEFAENPNGQITEWVSVAGTSAGSIIAALLACGKNPAQLEQLLRTTPYASFQDWGAGGEVLGGALNLARQHGLAHGEVFRTWMDKQLGGATFASVKTDPPPQEGSAYRLQMIATDLTRKQMIVLPDDLANYRVAGSDQPINPDAFKIADAVRMSMSIPYFFQPIELVNVDGSRSTIVDGGVLSNFPVWIFDTRAAQPKRPTFGFHLFGGRGVGGGLERVIGGLGWPVEMGVDIFHTATDAWDTRFMSHSTVVRTCPVSAGEIGTTDFDLKPAQQDWLVESGRQGAKTFLADFKRENYMNTYGRTLTSPSAGPERE